MELNPSRQIERYNDSYTQRQKYPKILSYTPSSTNEQEYVFTIRDVDVSLISKLELKLVLPEIKGTGSVSYIRDYPFLLVKRFDTFIRNKEDETFTLFESLDGEELCSRSKKLEQAEYFNSFGGENDHYCSMRKGTYNDCVIFPQREITIPIHLYNNYCYTYPTTDVEFRFTISNLTDIIMFNTVFNESSIKDSMSNFLSTSKNIKLNFTNTLVQRSDDRPTELLRIVKTTNFENGSETIISEKFKKAKNVVFYNKTNIFNEDDMKFVIPFGPSLNEKNLVKEWIKRILKDVVVVTDKDLLNDEDKESLGFSPSAVFQVVENNKVKKANKQVCKVFINNVPENFKVYYHKNILTFSRRRITPYFINVSDLFSNIRGSYFEDGTISFLMDEIEHNVTISHVSIPVNIWNDQNNTAEGDQRSESSRRKDVYYKNRFVNGMDILSKDTGFVDVALSMGRDKISHYYQTTRESALTTQYNLSDIYRNDRDSYPNRISFFTSHISEENYIHADETINFVSINASIKWKPYVENDPYSLYKRRPTILVYHVFGVKYNHGEQRINISDK